VIDRSVTLFFSSLFPESLRLCLFSYLSGLFSCLCLSYIYSRTTYYIHTTQQAPTIPSTTRKSPPFPFTSSLIQHPDTAIPRTRLSKQQSLTESTPTPKSNHPVHTTHWPKPPNLPQKEDAQPLRVKAPVTLESRNDPSIAKPRACSSNN